jgi:hypothetical protein
MALKRGGMTAYGFLGAQNRIEFCLGKFPKEAMNAKLKTSSSSRTLAALYYIGCTA